MELTRGNIAAVQERLQKKELSCAELTESYLQAMERDNPALNAYVTVTADKARAAAAATDKRLAAGEPLRPLEGVPMTLKDNLSTKGVETTCCSKILRGYVPIYDATVWELLQAQGAVLLGKTNMDEFAMGSSCETSCFGGAHNPHDTDHVAGGSSGGVAAAVAGNLAVYGLGSDTGGSIRQPSSFCGAVGLKPTYGAVSRYGLIAYASGFDQIGPITQTVADAARVFDQMAVYDKRDSTSSGKRESVSDKLTQSVKGLRIGVAKEYFDGLRPAVAAAMRQATDTLAELGAEMVEVSLTSLKYALPVYYILACAEASSNLGRYDGIRYGYQAEHYQNINDMICKTRSEGFGDEVQRRILLGTYVLSAGYYDAYYKKAQNLRGAIIADFAAAFTGCDVLLAPTVPMTAFRNGAAMSDPVETYLTDICTVPVNIAGLPAVSVPCGYDEDGLPVGLQLIGAQFDEATVLRAAYQYEQATRFILQKPTKWGVSV